MSEIIETINDEESKSGLNFVEQLVADDLAAGKNGGRLNTRFPPEPNGYLHIGHAKAICMDFGVAEKFGGTCNLRFDDTNPTKEDTEYVDAIRDDIHWLGFDWGDREYYASDYFPQLYDLAVRMIKEGKAYVDHQTSEEIARQKGTPTQPGENSPYRDRPVEENLDLFHRMNAGEFDEGTYVLRAKIDMASDNMHFRDPIMYRIIKTPHHRTGTTWNVYPMYDFAHGQSDYFEGVTHSICTLEFVPHRPLYDLFVDWVKNGQDLDDNRPRQYEFNKLNLNYTLNTGLCIGNFGFTSINNANTRNSHTILSDISCNNNFGLSIVVIALFLIFPLKFAMERKNNGITSFFLKIAHNFFHLLFARNKDKSVSSFFNILNNCWNEHMSSTMFNSNRI